MSNKPKKFKNAILQLGNFVITKESGSEHDWVRIKAVSGFWTISFRDDNAMFGWIIEMARDKETHVLLRYFINMNFMIGSTLPDGQFVKEFFESYTSYINRMVESKGVPTEKEESEAVEEMQTLYELQAELTELTKTETKNEGTGD